MKRSIIASTALIACAALAGTASAVFNPAMNAVSQPLSSFTNLVATLDIASTTYDFPFDATQFTNSGYIRSVGNTEIDRTGLVTNVYEVTQQTNVGGGLTLNAGDMVWAYTVDLVSASTNTVSSLSEFQVGGLSFLGTDVMDGSLVLGRGFVDTTVNTPIGNPIDFEDLGSLGSSLDWQWGPSVADQLGNSETITLLMFTSAANIGDGFANFIAPPVQATGVDPVANGAPVFIPTAIPAPGAMGLLLGFGLAGAARRRRV